MGLGFENLDFGNGRIVTDFNPEPSLVTENFGSFVKARNGWVRFCFVLKESEMKAFMGTVRLGCIDEVKTKQDVGGVGGVDAVGIKNNISDNTIRQNKRKLDPCNDDEDECHNEKRRGLSRRMEGDVRNK